MSLERKNSSLNETKKNDESSTVDISSLVDKFLDEDINELSNTENENLIFIEEDEIEVSESTTDEKEIIVSESRVDEEIDISDLTSENKENEISKNIIIEDDNLFGNYQIISQKNKDKDPYTKLNEDISIDSFTHKSDEQIISNIKSKFDKYKDERNEINNFIEHNGKYLSISEARSLIEAALFVLGNEGLNAYDIKRVTELPLAIVNNILDEMMYYYKSNLNSGIELVQYGNLYKFVTKKRHYERLIGVLNNKERKPLSESVMETLSIIAYNQPCTRSVVEKIRGRNCTNAFQRLEQLNLIEADERSDAIGKPWLYSVTQKFFDIYGIKSLSELPPINRNDKNYSDSSDEDANYISEINEEEIL